MKNTFTLISGLTILLFAGCNKQNEVKNYSQEEIQMETKKANEFFDKVFDDYVDRHPIDQSYLGIKKDQDKWNDISDEHEAAELEIVKSNLEKLKKDFSLEKLNEQGKLSYRIFEFNARQKIENFRWRFHNYPVNQLFGLHSEIPSFLINIHQIEDTTDARAYISRLQKVGPLLDQLIKNVSARVEKGIVPPKYVFSKVMEDCKNITTGAPFEKTKVKSSLLDDFTNKVSKLSIDAELRTQLIKDAESALVDSVQPAYNKLVIYLSNLESIATHDDGVWKFPEGNLYYQAALKQMTTTDMASDEVYTLGVKEVERIHGQMREIMKKVNFEGDSLPDFFKYMREDKKFYYPNDANGKAAYLKRTIEIIDTMRLSLNDLFITKPKAELIVKAVEPFREKSAAGAFYQEPAPDGSRPGIYYANLYDMSAMPNYEMEALAYHEAIPGHHMQLSIAQELQGIPKFRRYASNFIAYVEGWGLYSELIPKELGFYRDPYSDFGRLSMELLRAGRLVVDVGIHHKKWTRQQAIDYFMKNTPNSEIDCRREIERYIVMPGQATAYKIGMIKILDLRAKAKKELGAKFNIKEFHEEVLKYGALPLLMLEENIDLWIKSKA